MCFATATSGPGSAGDPAWAAAVLWDGSGLAGRATVLGEAEGPYVPGLLGMREGRVLEAAVRALAQPPDVLLVDGTGRDHPRRAGLALQLGWALEVPTVGVTHRTLLASGAWPADERGAASPIRLDGDVVAQWVRTRQGARPVASHAAWRTTPLTALRVVLAASGEWRTPEPLRQARRLARQARSGARGLDVTEEG